MFTNLNHWSEKSECGYCGAMITTKNLRRHMKDVHLKKCTPDDAEPRRPLTYNIAGDYGV